MIEVKNLTKRYGITVAVKDVSFTVNKGEVLGFLGPNGAGKTTTMKVLTCFMPPTDGTAEVAGYDILQNPLEVRKRIGYLPESTPLYTDMTVEEYLSFIAEIRKIPSLEKSKRVNKMVDICNLRTVFKKDIGELSKGFKQRVGLAQALIHDPEILVLDEPTSGLDPNQIIEIRQLIKELGKEKTIILSTHILPEVSATCGRVIIINDGKLVASGTPGELQDSSKGDSIVYATVRAPENDIKTLFSQTDSIKEFSQIEKNDGALRYKLVFSKTETDPGLFMFKMAVGKGWELSEIHKESLSLEDVFLKLTTREKQ